jgi:hypothetical protein
VFGRTPPPVLRFDSHPSNLKASGDTRRSTACRDLGTGVPSVEFSLLGGLILLHIMLAWV